MDEASFLSFMLEFVDELNRAGFEFVGGYVVLPPIFKTRKQILALALSFLKLDIAAYDLAYFHS